MRWATNGAMLMAIGAVLAGGAVWSALGSPRWPEQLPLFFVGLSLAAFGLSGVRKAGARRRGVGRDEARQPGTASRSRDAGR